MTKTRFVKIGPTGKHLSVRASKWVAVYDSLHDLTWSRTIGDQPVRQPQALKIASDLDLLEHSDWQLGTRAQLLTLVDDTRARPAIDIRYFPNCRPSWYWTRTPFASSPSGYAWYVYFLNGYSGCYSQDFQGFVRAVRPGQ